MNQLGGALVIIGLLALAGTTMPYGLLIIAVLGAIVVTA